MAFEHYIAVRNSDLYEYKGFAKAILLTIAHLIISEPEENEQGKTIGERDPDAGWCVAGEQYIAAALGISVACVSKNAVQIRKDGWLEIETWRNRFGHLHNKYRIPADKLGEIKARVYKKDATGNIIRGVQTNKVRKLERDKGRFLTARSGKDVGQPYGDPTHALGTGDSRVPSLLGAEEPNGSERLGLTARSGSQGVAVCLVSRFHQQVEKNRQIATHFVRTQRLRLWTPQELRSLTTHKGLRPLDTRHREAPVNPWGKTSRLPPLRSPNPAHCLFRLAAAPRSRRPPHLFCQRRTIATSGAVGSRTITRRASHTRSHIASSAAAGARA